MLAQLRFLWPGGGRAEDSRALGLFSCKPGGGQTDTRQGPETENSSDRESQGVREKQETGEREETERWRRDRKYYPENEAQGKKSGEQQEQPRMLWFAEDSDSSLRQGCTTDSTFLDVETKAQRASGTRQRSHGQSTGGPGVRPRPD